MTLIINSNQKQGYFRNSVRKEEALSQWYQLLWGSQMMRPACQSFPFAEPLNNACQAGLRTCHIFFPFQKTTDFSYFFLNHMILSFFAWQCWCHNHNEINFVSTWIWPIQICLITFIFWLMPFYCCSTPTCKARDKQGHCRWDCSGSSCRCSYGNCIYFIPNNEKKEKWSICCFKKTPVWVPIRLPNIY